MQVNNIQGQYSSNFKGLPPRHYAYELPKGHFGGQAEAQMPKVREQINDFARKDDIITSMQNLQTAIKTASKHLAPESQRAQNSLIKYSDMAIHTNIVTNQELKSLIALSAQSAYQQDKHDAIWLFNKYNERQNTEKLSTVISLAQAFRNLDRTHDSEEIEKAEASLKEIYKNSSAGTQADIAEIYGRAINFSA